MKRLNVRYPFHNLIAISMTPTTVQCMTSPYPYRKRVRIRLMIEDNYIVENSYLYFLFDDAVKINSMFPNEGFIAGGNTITVSGNFTILYDKPYQLFHGSVRVDSTDILKSSPEVIQYIVPPVTTVQIVQMYLTYDGVTYTNETVLYYYKTYSELHTIWPNYGPTNGGTLVRVTGKDFDD
jgi:IPT/TIG domain